MRLMPLGDSSVQVDCLGLTFTSHLLLSMHSSNKKALNRAHTSTMSLEASSRHTNPNHNPQP